MSRGPPPKKSSRGRRDTSTQGRGNSLHPARRRSAAQESASRRKKKATCLEPAGAPLLKTSRLRDSSEIPLTAEETAEGKKKRLAAQEEGEGIILAR